MAGAHTSKPDHDYHLVDPSPWPILTSFAFMFAAGGAAFYFHNKPYAEYVMIGGLLALFYVAYRWWADCIAEGKARPSNHTSIVQKGLRLGMIMFIVSEVMFFFAFFFSYFHSHILPMEVMGDGNWPVSEGSFPPEGQKTISPWSLPLFNTLLLLMSGTTVTWAHVALLNNNRKELVRALWCTVTLGLIFTGVQALEYHHILEDYFKLSDHNYSSNFFMATGFHGLHVIIGTIFLIVCLISAKKGEMTEKHHLRFEFAAWYWHFVDVVWLFLFIFVYIDLLGVMMK